MLKGVERQPEEIFREVFQKTGVSREEICLRGKRGPKIYKARTLFAQLAWDALYSDAQIARVMNKSDSTISDYLGRQYGTKKIMAA